MNAERNAVTVARTGAVHEITLDRPKANAIDPATSRALGDAFAAFRDDPAARVAIFTAAGDRFFSAGWDLKSAASGEAQDYGVGGFFGLTEMFDLNKPVIAAVNGLAAGGGFEVALACDLIISADDAQFGQPEIRVGIMPGAGGTQRLLRTVGRYQALLWCLTGQWVPAREAHAAGLVSELVAKGRALERAIELAEQLGTMPPLAVQAIREAMRLGADVPLDTALALERRLFDFGMEIGWVAVQSQFADIV